jgi:hypothetical protein
MMTRTAALSALLSLFVVTGATQASTTVDFSVLGINTVDITMENYPPPLTINGVTFGYDNFGSVKDWAQADAAGVYGTTYGVLALNFANPAVGLRLDFSVFGVPGAIGPGTDTSITLTAFTDNFNADTVVVPGTFVPFDAVNPTSGGVINGSLNYLTPAFPFNQAFLYFTPFTDPTDPTTGSFLSPAPDPQYFFSVGNISYDAAIPEPATIIVWSLLVGLGIGLTWWRKRAA